MGGMEVNELGDLSRSAVCELANIIMGTAAGLLSQRKINVDITPPTMVTRDGVMISSDKMTTICIPITWDNSNRSLELDISISQAPK